MDQELILEEPQPLFPSENRVAFDLYRCFRLIQMLLTYIDAFVLHKCFRLFQMPRLLTEKSSSPVEECICIRSTKYEI